jgi:hypothetical protein
LPAPVLPPDGVVTLLRARALHLSGTVWKMEAQLAKLARQDLSAMTTQDLPLMLAGQEVSAALVGRERIPARATSSRRAQGNTKPRNLRPTNRRARFATAHRNEGTWAIAARSA